MKLDHLQFNFPRFVTRVLAMKIVISIETFALLLNICPEKFLASQEDYWSRMLLTRKQNFDIGCTFGADPVECISLSCLSLSGQSCNNILVIGEICRIGCIWCYWTMFLASWVRDHLAIFWGAILVQQCLVRLSCVDLQHVNHRIQRVKSKLQFAICRLQDTEL